MKIRGGFVSNSSTSCFIIRGIQINIDEFLKALKLPAQEDIEEDMYSYLEDKIDNIEFDYREDSGTLTIGEGMGSVYNNGFCKIETNPINLKIVDEHLTKRLTELGLPIPSEYITYAISNVLVHLHK